MVLLGAGAWAGGRSLFGPPPEVLRPAEGEQLDALEASDPLVSWHTLMSVSDAAGRPSELPADLAALNGRAVSIDGYMLPLEASDDRVTSFFLNTYSDRCAFGPPSNAQDRVEVSVSSGHAVTLTHCALRVFGVLTIKPVFESGALVGLYSLRLNATGPPGLGF